MYRTRKKKMNPDGSYGDSFELFCQELENRVGKYDSKYAKSLQEKAMQIYIYEFTKHDKNLAGSFVEKYIGNTEFRNRHFNAAYRSRT